MEQSPGSRACTAPGASPTVHLSNPSTIPSNPYLPTPDNKEFSNFDFSQPFGTNQTFSDQPLPAEGTNYASYLQNSAEPPTYDGSASSVGPAAPASSTDLVRRTKNQQLASQMNGGLTGQEQWHTSGYGTMSGQNMEDEDEQDLERKVQEAKREAQSKRKQIPPFVQKLSR